MRYETRYIPERRGYGTSKGVPDAIVWCITQDTATNAHWRFPILVELETNFEDAIRDFQEFSKRSLMEGDHLIIPISQIGAQYSPRIRYWEITYSLRECSILACCGNYWADEHDLYLQLRNLVNSSSLKANLKSLPSDIGNFVDAEWIMWIFNFFGVKLECILPLLRIRNLNDGFEKEISKYFRQSRLPGLVVTRSGRQNRMQLMYPTAVSFEILK